jgi:hypothetical protein
MRPRWSGHALPELVHHGTHTQTPAGCSPADAIYLHTYIHHHHHHGNATQGFFSVHGDAALMVARDFYHTTAVVKHLGGSGDAGGTPGAGARPAAAGLPSVTLNKTLFETVLRSLLLEGGQHSVELWEGAGASWQLTRCGQTDTQTDTHF